MDDHVRRRVQAPQRELEPHGRATARRIAVRPQMHFGGAGHCRAGVSHDTGRRQRQRVKWSFRQMQDPAGSHPRPERAGPGAEPRTRDTRSLPGPVERHAAAGAIHRLKLRGRQRHGPRSAIGQGHQRREQVHQTAGAPGRQPRPKACRRAAKWQPADTPRQRFGRRPDLAAGEVGGARCPVRGSRRRQQPIQRFAGFRRAAVTLRCAVGLSRPRIAVVGRSGRIASRWRRNPAASRRPPQCRQPSRTAPGTAPGPAQQPSAPDPSSGHGPCHSSPVRRQPVRRSSAAARVGQSVTLPGRCSSHRRRGCT